MKKSFPYRLIMAGTALFLSTLTVFPAFAADLSGHLDAVSASSISGWAWNSDAPAEAVSVELTISGGNGPGAGSVITVSASLSREDLKTALGSGDHGFSYEIDWSKFEGETFTVSAAAISGDTKTPLIGSFTYNKEETITPDAAGAPESSGPAAEIPKTEPVSAVSEKAAGTSVTLTADQMALGPGYMYDASLNKTAPKGNSYGPGMSGAPIETGEADQLLGTFEITAYCNCESCSGGHSLTYSGTVPKANHTIAADLDVFPLGTKLLINNIVYTVEDMGSNVNDERLDIFFATHEEALAFGMQNLEVYSVK